MALNTYYMHEYFMYISLTARFKVHAWYYKRGGLCAECGSLVATHASHSKMLLQDSLYLVLYFVATMFPANRGKHNSHIFCTSM